MDSARPARPAGPLPWLAAQALVALGAVGAMGVGDPTASGIVEEGLGGPGSAVLVGGTLLALPALVAGVAYGVLATRASATARAARWVVALVLGGLAALWIVVATEMECDGTCTRRPTSTLLGALLVAELALLVGGWTASVFARVVRRRG